jgi:hypothetical protein
MPDTLSQPKIQALSWIGFTLNDYIQMFDLTDSDLTRKILDYNAGCASFTQELALNNPGVMACDNLYQHSPAVLWDKLNHLAMNSNAIKALLTPAFINERAQHIPQMMAHYAKVGSTHYLNSKIENLIFPDEAFHLALSAYALFTVTDHLSETYHINAILELLRVANEVRIFPLTNLQGKVSPYIGTILSGLQQQGLDTEIKTRQFQPHIPAQAMLRVWSAQCKVAP